MPLSIYGNTNQGTFPSPPILFEDIAGNQLAGFALMQPGSASMVLNATKYFASTDMWSGPIMQKLEGFTQTFEVSADELGNVAVLLGLSTTNTPPFNITLAQLLGDKYDWAPQIILGEDFSSDPVVAVSARQGVATLAWKINTPSLQVQTMRLFFSAQQTSPLPNLPLPPTTTDVVGMNMAVDSLGDAVIIYGALIGSNVLMYASTLLASENATWSSPQLISNPAHSVLTGTIASDAAGTTTILWGEQASPDQQFALAATLPLGGTPTFVTNLTNENTENTTVDATSTVVMDSFGNAAAIWVEASGGNEMIKTASKPKGENWTEPTTLSFSGTTPLISLSDQGTSIAIWVDSKYKVLFGTRDSSLFYLAPPSKFIGKLNGKGDMLKMSWNPSPAPGIAYYQIYKNNKLIATIPGSGPYRYLQPTSRNDPRNYKIRAVASNGNKSLFVPIKILKECWQW